MDKPLDLMWTCSAGQVTRFGMVSMCVSIGQTGHKVLSIYMPLKSFLMPAMVLDLSLKRVDCSFLLNKGLHR